MFAPKFESHQDQKTRVEDVEAARFRLRHKDTVSRTIANRNEEIRHETLAHFTRTFEQQTIGIHGKELPKFSLDERVKEWWRNKGDYVADPKNTSALRLSQERKFWAKNDQILLADQSLEGPAVDPFRVEYTKQRRKDNVPDKPTQMPFHADEFKPHFDSPGCTSYKWTSIEREFRTPGNARIFEAQKSAREEPRDFAPLYSCFNPKGVFNPPKLKPLIDASPSLSKDKSSALSPQATKRTLGGTMNEASGSQSVFSRIGLTKKGDFNVTSAQNLRDSVKLGIRSGGFSTMAL